MFIAVFLAFWAICAQTAEHPMQKWVNENITVEKTLRLETTPANLCKDQASIAHCTFIAVAKANMPTYVHVVVYDDRVKNPGARGVNFDDSSGNLVIKVRKGKVILKTLTPPTQENLSGILSDLRKESEDKIAYSQNKKIVAKVTLKQIADDKAFISPAIPGKEPASNQTLNQISRTAISEASLIGQRIIESKVKNLQIKCGNQICSEITPEMFIDILALRSLLPGETLSSARIRVTANWVAKPEYFYEDENSPCSKKTLECSFVNMAFSNTLNDVEIVGLSPDKYIKWMTLSLALNYKFSLPKSQEIKESDLYDFTNMTENGIRLDDWDFIRKTRQIVATYM